MTAPIKHRKKLIEVALPLEAINKAATAEKSNPFLKGHPRNLHQWWARRPLAAARAVIFSQMVDDPSASPDLFPTEKAQEKERKRLFKIIEELVQWENTTNEEVLQRAREEIWQSWRRTCAENADHPRGKDLFNRHTLPPFYDPFAGGGALPLEAQRLGFNAYASDLNPVAVLICKALIEDPPAFDGQPPLNPESRKRLVGTSGSWKGAQGLAEDLRYYGRWLCLEAQERIQKFYPEIEITIDLGKQRPDLRPLVGQKVTPIAYIWARTVKSPNPAFAAVEVPLVTTFLLCGKKSKQAWIEPIVTGREYQFAVRIDPIVDSAAVKRGTKAGASGSSFVCLMSGVPIPFDYIRAEGKAGRIGHRLMAIVAEGDRHRIYLPATPELESVAKGARPRDVPETPLPKKALSFRVQEYGMTKWADLFTARQLLALTTLSDLLRELPARVRSDAEQTGTVQGDRPRLNITHYAKALTLLLALAADKFADYDNTICTWNPGNENIGHLFTKHAIPMAWDFPETSPLSGGLSIASIAEGVSLALEGLPARNLGQSFQQDCATVPNPKFGLPVISTDPPYFDNIGYADLSDFFYFWLRRTLKELFPDLFATISVPKAEELIASPIRQGSKEAARRFFLAGMTKAMKRLSEIGHPACPITIYYAFKQSETETELGTASTGWEAFLEAVLEAGFTLTGTWPIRTERETRSVGQGTNALASSIVLVCRHREIEARTITRREFLSQLKSALPTVLANLQRTNIAPVDIAQSAIGPGMEVYSRYSKVMDAQDRPISVREALSMINGTLDELLAEQEGDFDADTRWAITWFEQLGFAEGEYGVAETLSIAKNTSVRGIVDAGIARSKAGKVQLLKPNELPVDWDPTTDFRLTHWEIVHHLIRALESGGESDAAEIVTKLGSKAETARELCYRLYTLCERKKRAAEALSYNALVQSWPEILRLAKEQALAVPVQQELV